MGAKSKDPGAASCNNADTGHFTEIAHRDTARGELPESAFFSTCSLGMFRLRDAFDSRVSSLNMTGGEPLGMTRREGFSFCREST